MAEIELCKILFEGMKLTKSEYLTSVYSTIGLIVVGIGWLITSEQAQSIISRQQKLAAWLKYVIVFIVAFHWVNLGTMSFRSWEIQELFVCNCSNELDIHTEQAIKPFIIFWYWPYTSALLSGVLAFVFIYLINNIVCKKDKEHE